MNKEYVPFVEEIKDFQQSYAKFETKLGVLQDEVSHSMSFGVFLSVSYNPSTRIYMFRDTTPSTLVSFLPKVVLQGFICDLLFYAFELQKEVSK